MFGSPAKDFIQRRWLSTATGGAFGCVSFGRIARPNNGSTPRSGKKSPDTEPFCTSTGGASPTVMVAPPPPNALVARIFVRGVDEVRPSGWVMADDGMLFTLPPDSDAIERGEIE